MSVSYRTATFVANGRVVRRVRFDRQGLGAPIPEVPRRNGFVGEWAPTDLGDEDVTVEAIYRPVRIRFVQLDGSSVIAGPGDPSPDVLEAEGCVGEWEPFAVSDRDITVNPRYRGPRHTLRLTADGRLVGEVLRRAREFPPMPPVPRKAGFEGRWRPYVPREGVVEVEAEYRPLMCEYEVGIGRVETLQEGQKAPELPSREGCDAFWSRRRTLTGDSRMSIRYDGTPRLTGFDEAPEHVPAPVQEKPSDVPPHAADERPEEGASEEADDSRDLHLERVRMAVEELGFISEHWSTVEEEDRPPSPVNSINHIADTCEGTEWEALACRLSPLQKEYLAACVGMRGAPQEVLKRHGTTMLAVETGINALAEDIVGDPVVDGGEVDPEYVSEIEEVLKDGNQGRKEVG